MQVALTRPPEKDAELAQRLEEEGFSPVFVPVVAYEKLEDGYEALEIALTEPWDWVVITSPEAARYFIGAWYLAGAPEVRIAALGPSTKAVLEGQGLEVAFVPSRAEGKALAAELPGPGRVLWPTSARAGDELARGLSERGFSVRRIDAYTLVPRRPDEAERRLAATSRMVLFGSPSAVRAWVEAGLPRLPAACVGATTARAAEAMGFEPVAYPERPGLEGWVEAARSLSKKLLV